MILNETKPTAETFGVLDEKFFGMADQGMIFDILRSKLYSNPILAICREISCNARDAHREVGKFDVPIHIHLPFALEPVFKIRDEGPGISPDRMVNIFINYTASTKRDSNVFCGGFGLGSKTPYSYSDQFTIETIHDGIKYNYACFIDETKIGKLALLNKVPTDEPNGTEISIPVKNADFNFFRSYTEQACRHWDVKPVITGGTIQWQTLNKVLEGEGWAIASSEDYNRVAKLIIDGVEYPLELNALRKYADSKLIDAAQGNFVMYFGVGELSLSANREQIFLDKPTQDKIRHRMDDVVKVVHKQVEDKIQSFPNLWEANIYYRKDLTKVFNDLNFLGLLTWKGHALHRGYIQTQCTIFSFSKGKYSRKHGNNPNKLSRSQGPVLQFIENCALYINDLSLREPSAKHVKKAFDDDPTLTNMQVICPNDKCTEADLNTSIALDHMQPKKLSSITKASARNYTASLSRMLVFKFDGKFCRSSYDKMEQDTGTTRVLCLLERDTAGGERTATSEIQTVSGNKRWMWCRSIHRLQEIRPGVSFYGVDKAEDIKRLNEECPNTFISLDDLVKEIINDKTINYVGIKYAQNHLYDIETYAMKNMEQLAPFIADPNSCLLKHYQTYKKIKELAGNAEALNIYEDFNGAINDTALNKFVKDNPEYNVAGLRADINKKYPLLDNVSWYSTGKIYEHIGHYINAVDKL